MANILDRLADTLPDLPTKMAAAARFALDNPDRIAVNSMRAVAAEVGVASPTMLRLARLMDFESYEDFKAAFQDEVIGEGFSARAGRLGRSGAVRDSETLIQEIGKAAVANVGDALAACDPAVLRAMAKALLGARTSYVIGAGSMHSVATLMQFTGRMVLPDLRVPRSGDATMIETIGGVRREDVVLALAVSPYARSSVEALRFARERGATIMVISDRRTSPMVPFADLYLLAATKSPHYYPSFVAVVAVVEALLATVVAEGGPKVVSQIDEIEKMRERTGAYLK